MSEGKHTPGKWILGNENNSCAEVCIGDTDMVASMSRESSYTGEMVMSRADMLANARLIAAAPELLEALEDAVRFIELLKPHARGAWNDGDSASLQLLRQAIEKATGADKPCAKTD